MTIVVRGLGLTSGDGVATLEFGYTRAPLGVPSLPTIQELLGSSIANFYVVDHRVKRRRPATPTEWALFRQFLKIRARADTREEARALVAKLARQHIVIDSFQVRTPYPNDFSGLQPAVHKSAKASADDLRPGKVVMERIVVDTFRVRAPDKHDDPAMQTRRQAIAKPTKASADDARRRTRSRTRVRDQVRERRA